MQAAPSATTRSRSRFPNQHCGNGASEHKDPTALGHNGAEQWSGVAPAKTCGHRAVLDPRRVATKR